MGTVATAVSQQAVYAAAPLMVALSLNAINRHRFQQQTQQYTKSAIAEVHHVVESLHHQRHTLPPAKTVDLNPINQSLAQLAQQFDNRPELGQIQELKDALSSLPHPLELEKVIACQIEKSAQVLALEINRQLAAIKPYEYRLAIDRPGSRAVFMEALALAQERLILVCPWPNIYGVNSEVIQKLEELLKRKVRVAVGWGHLKDIDKVSSIGSIRQRLKSSSYLYSALPELETLEQKYPDRFQLKLLGTHEKFIVCDRSWTMLGSHNFLTSDTKSTEREVGLRTNDPRIITDLIKRFDTAKDLEKP
ncbi:hypothetical protein H6F74_02420 [Trichocoleus sp. FACHB-90]|uniref:phospholipase D-like domain-containing protein n=1 Tax=Cyanophyceae TaxID=3028117 RepID=UPI0016830C9F|nr:phospholipase D-like domain-containing protein [Trichocoleus sp. FACHB-90]MBD1925142.1 hypothetical protein [Trichocoleus sp. FACHB-90]